MAFLKSEVENEERIKVAKSGFGIERPDRYVNKFKSTKKDYPTAEGLFTANRDETDNRSCKFCDRSHNTFDCKFASKLPLDERKKLLFKSHSCFICLKGGHLARACKCKLNCRKCQKRHYAIMCPEIIEKGVENKDSANSESVAENISDLSNRTCTEEVLLQTLTVMLRGKDKDRAVRAIIDTGSQKSYISKEAVADMDYSPIGEENTIHNLFGCKKMQQKHLRYKIVLSNLEKHYNCRFEVLDEKNICVDIPRSKIGPWLEEAESKGIFPCDQFSHIGDVSTKIHVLIGADIAGKLFTGRMEQLSCGLVAMETRLGWTIMGKLSCKNSPKDSISASTSLSMFLRSETTSKLWELEAIGIQDPTELKTKKERENEVLESFNQTVTCDSEGRYEIRLPWIKGHPPLSRNFDVAKKRLDRVVQKLKDEQKMSVYEDVFGEWLQEGIIEEVPESEWDEGHYLPHRPVYKENSTTKVRPVFDASAREQSNPSLNQCLEKGGNLIEIIPSILIRFRLHQIGVIGDIKKAFLQISVNEDDRDFLRFLWIDEAGNIKIFRHKRVVFGVTSSPFLLGAVIDYHLKTIIENSENKYLVNTVEKLKKSFYVDNCTASVENEVELYQFVTGATTVFADGGFELRGWEFSDPDLSEESSTEVLGLTWNKREDHLSVRVIDNIEVSKVTRRTILSLAQRIFDPIGFTCPNSLCPKLLLQQCWTMKGNWDDEVPDDIRKAFLSWAKELVVLKEIKIPRWLRGMDAKLLSCSIHTFCDASKLAYAAVVFVRFEYDSFVNIQLVQAKSRVTPLKEMSIPRLELLAANIAARLTSSIHQEFEVFEKPISTTFWSDSTVVIAWIKREENWRVFVRNRVSEIRNLTSKDSWRHVPGNINPADPPSRGCSARQLLESKWWEGPSWLKQVPEEWPSQEPEASEEEIEMERQKIKVCSLLSNAEAESAEWFHAFSSDYMKVVRVFAWMQRFTNNCRKDSQKYKITI